MKNSPCYRKDKTSKESDFIIDRKTSVVSITALVDETGDLGSRIHGSKYIIGATVLKNNQVDRFGKIMDEIIKNEKEEPKFHNARDPLRREVLDEISKINPRIYVVTIGKPRLKKWTSGEKKRVHYYGVKKLIKRIAKKEDAICLHVIFDTTTLISEGVVKEMIKIIGKKTNKKLTFEIRDSKTCSPLQTNDFVIGSLGKRYNRKDERYISCLNSKVDRKRLINKTNLFSKSR